MNALSAAGLHDFDPRPTASPIETLYATAHFLIEQMRIADATAVLRVMLHRAPKDERAWLALGECHAKLGHINIALELLGTGAVATKSGRCHLARARIFARLGRESDVTDELEHAASLADGDDELGALVRQVAEALR